MIQFNASPSPSCALSVACNNALPHVSSTKFHNSSSMAANMASENFLSSSLNLYDALCELENFPAADVPPRSLSARLLPSLRAPPPPPPLAFKSALPASKAKNFRATGLARLSNATSTAFSTNARPMGSNTSLRNASVLASSASFAPSVLRCFSIITPIALSSTLDPNNDFAMT